MLHLKLTISSTFYFSKKNYLMHLNLYFEDQVILYHTTFKKVTSVSRGLQSWAWDSNFPLHANLRLIIQFEQALCFCLSVGPSVRLCLALHCGIFPRQSYPWTHTHECTLFFLLSENPCFVLDARPKATMYGTNTALETEGCGLCAVSSCKFLMNCQYGTVAKAWLA